MKGFYKTNEVRALKLSDINDLGVSVSNYNFTTIGEFINEPIYAQLVKEAFSHFRRYADRFNHMWRSGGAKKDPNFKLGDFPF